MARDGESHYRVVSPISGSTFGDSRRAKMLRLPGLSEHELRRFGSGMSVVLHSARSTSGLSGQKALGLMGFSESLLRISSSGSRYF